MLSQYQASLKLKGDAKNGREIFKKNCATCHRVAGVGIDVGPDIADTRTKTLDALLNDIIAPNSAIDANYVNYLVTTKDGRVLTGLLTAETASSITLKRAGYVTEVGSILQITPVGLALFGAWFDNLALRIVIFSAAQSVLIGVAFGAALAVVLRALSSRNN